MGVTIMQVRHSERTRVAPRLVALAKYFPSPVWSRELWLTSIRPVVRWGAVLNLFRRVIRGPEASAPECPMSPPDHDD